MSLLGNAFIDTRPRNSSAGSLAGHFIATTEIDDEVDASLALQRRRYFDARLHTYELSKINIIDFVSFDFLDSISGVAADSCHFTAAALMPCTHGNI